MNVLGKKPTSKETLRASNRELSAATRGIGKDISALQLEEKRLVVDIKRTAKTGNNEATRILALQLVRLRKQISTLQGNQAQMRGIATQTRVAHANNSLAVGIQGASKAMASMNKRISPAEQMKVLKEFQKQSGQMDLVGEVISDTMDDALGSDELDEESDNLTSQVLDEIGIDFASQLSAAPKGKLAIKTAQDAGSSGLGDLEKRMQKMKHG